MVAVRVEVTLLMSVTLEAKLLTVEDCHLVTLPVFPLRVRTVLFVPVQTVALPATVPPTEAGLIVTIAVVLGTTEHAPLVSMAR